MNNKLTNLSLLAGALLIGGQANGAASYTFTDLGRGSALGINNSGQVAGYSNNNDTSNAVVWNGTTATRLLGGSNGIAVAINDSGQVVGNINNNSAGALVVWNSTTATSIGYVYPNGSVGYAINNAGQVAGWDGGHTPVSTGNGIMVTNLGQAINDVGQVVGNSDPNNITTMWTTTGHGTTVTELGTWAWPFAINNAGQVVGVSFNPYGGNPTLWNTTGNVVTTIILSNGGGSANAINNSGLIVGIAVPSNGYNLDPNNQFYNPSLAYIGTPTAFLWNGTTATDLNSFLTADEINAGWTLTDANGINDSGSIVGPAHNSKTGAYDAYLLTAEPSVGAVPEPETYAQMLAGLGALGFVARRCKLR